MAANFHYMDDSARTKHGEFAEYVAAAATCRRIVDEHLASAMEPGMTADALYASYKAFGDDPYIIGPSDTPHFSAWGYAKERCHELCGGGGAAAPEQINDPAG